MSMSLTAAPAVEPVTLAEAKAHLRVDADGEDAFITSLIVTSRLQIEAALGLALITQSWQWTLDAWPDSAVIALPMRPVQSIASIEISRATAGVTTLPPTGFILDASSTAPRLVLTTAPPAPEIVAAGIAISFTAGFGATAGDVPEPIRHALLLLVAHWFENREPQSAGESIAAIPAAVSSLLAPFREVRL